MGYTTLNKSESVIKFEGYVRKWFLVFLKSIHCPVIL